jgi:hypothetical protein
MVKRFVWAVLPFVVAACFSATEPRGLGVVLTPAKTVYIPGETITAELANNSPSPIGYGACALRLQRQQGPGWILVGPDEVPCIMVMIVLDPGAKRTLSLPIDPALPSGVYRLVFGYSPDTKLPDRVVYSLPFTFGFSSTQ